MTYKIGAKLYKRNYYLKNRDKTLARVKSYKLSHQKELAESRRRYYLQNQEQIVEKQKKYAMEHKLEKVEYKRKYHLLNKVRLVKKAVEWGKNNKDRRKIIKDRWRAKNREKTNFLARLYIYRKKGAGGYPTFKQINDLYAKYLGLCVYCNLSKATTIDHVIPISRGGSNDIENLLPACVSCNSQKGAKLLTEWKPEVYGN